MANEILRKAIAKANLKYWEYADLIAWNPSALSRFLRYEMPQSVQEKAVHEIDEYQTGQAVRFSALNEYNERQKNERKALKSAALLQYRSTDVYAERYARKVESEINASLTLHSDGRWD